MTKVILPFALLFPVPLVASPVFEDLAALDARIGAETGGARPLDPRLRLARCPVPATIEAAVVRCEPLGWRVRLIPLANAAAPLVRRGDAVSVSIVGRGFKVNATGIAQQDAGAGQPVRIKGPNDQLLTGRAVAPGVVEVVG